MIAYESTSDGRGPLSPRELLLVSLAAVGLTDKEIAIKVRISLPTVKTYWQRIRQKFGAVNRAQCVAKYRDVYAEHQILADEELTVAHLTPLGSDLPICLPELAEVSDCLSEPAEKESHFSALSPLLSESDAAAWLGTDKNGLRRYLREGRLSCNPATRVYSRVQVQALADDLAREILRAPAPEVH